ncbi:MAG: hypothetical protein RLZZ200_783 [Pseudomonadota bacterium]|jgi:aryl-alcohol dehydrogenase
MRLEFWRQGRFPLERLVSTFYFTRIGDAFDAFRRGEVIKPVLRIEVS